MKKIKLLNPKVKRNKIFGSHHCYGGSTSFRWLVCTASTKEIIKDCKAGKITLDTISIHAEKGTAVHDVNEKCRKRGLKPIQFLGKKIKVDKFSFIVDESFIESSNAHLENIENVLDECEDPIEYVEQSFDMTVEANADCGGSGDNVIIDLFGGAIHVYDYKNGQGIVEVKNNSQCWLYGIWAYLKLSKADQKKIKFIIVGISQPNVYHVDGSFRVEKIRVKKLLRWWKNIAMDAIDISERGEGEFVASEKGCEWCPRAPYCVENNKEQLNNDFGELINNKKELLAPNELTKEEIKKILDAKPKIEAYLRKIYFYALGAADKGDVVDDYKLVKSLSNRKYIDIEDTEKRLISKCKKNFYTEHTIKTPAQLETFLKVVEGWKPLKIKRFMDKNTERFETSTKLVPINSYGEGVATSLEDDFAEIVSKKKRKN